MNREDAINLIAEFMAIDDWSLVYMPNLHDALEVAIEALKDTPVHLDINWLRFRIMIADVLRIIQI